MRPATAKFLLKAMGWTLVGTPPIPVKNCIFLEAPHTSLWDFLIGYLYYRSGDGHLRIMIKKEMFFFPLGNLLRAMGGFPVDRKNAKQTILNIIHEMESSDKPFHLAMCPEGTRKPIRKWKTGYHIIAKEVGIPVYVTYVDWGHKRVGIDRPVELTDNAREDTDRIQKIYKELGVVGRHPENFLTE